MTLAPYTDTRTDPHPAVPDASCRVRIATLGDTRTDPGVIGVYFGKAVMAPDDRPGWLRGIVGALAARSVTPIFEDDQAGSAHVLEADVVLEKAWITNVANDIAAGVVFRVDERDANGEVAQARFRGTQQKMTYFSSGEGKIQRGIDSAFEQALDSMAEHFLTECRGRLVTAG